MASTFNDIPVELLLRIFTLQPMNSLALLRNVCKLWDQIISSEHFNNFHLARERTSSNTNRYLLVKDARGRGSVSTSLLDSQQHIYHDIPMKSYECYGICDGLLCLSSITGFSKEHSTIVLWNPIFRKVLPPLKIRYSELTYTCFGHHEDDYKVIKVVVFPRNYNVCIYSLSTNSWKIREFDGAISRNYNYNYKLGSWLSLYCTKSRFLNGIAYFLDYSGNFDHVIISFDLKREIFRELPVHPWYDFNFIIEEYKESLALIGRMTVYYHFRNIERVVMLVLRESNNSFSWEVMELCQRETDCQLKPVGFINKDELVMRLTHPNAVPACSFFLWNVEDQLPRQLTTPGLCTAIVQSSGLISFITPGFDARTSSFVDLGKYVKPICPPTQRRTRQPTRQSTIKDVASTSNSYAALADSGAG